MYTKSTRYAIIVLGRGNCRIWTAGNATGYGRSNSLDNTKKEGNKHGKTC